MAPSSRNDIDTDAVLSHILRQCGGVQADEHVLLICDPDSRSLAEAMSVRCAVLGARADIAQINGLARHGEEPPATVARSMLGADLIMSLCRFSLAHTTARLNSAKHARFLSLPQYDWAMLNEPAVMVDYQAQASNVRRFADTFDRGAEIRVKTQLGTDIAMDIRGRRANSCPGFVRRPGELGSPPDIEANISPDESSSEGMIVVDGSITAPELGLLQSAVTLAIERGLIVRACSPRNDYIKTLDDMLGPLGSPRRVLAECGVGLNPLARLSGSMLTDEGAIGCVHFGFGANHTVGGQNEVDFHLDFVVREASLWVDDIQMIENGVLV